MNQTARAYARVMLAISPLAGCAAIDPPMYVEGELVSSAGAPPNCVLAVTDSADGREFTAPISAKFAQPITLYPDDRNYRFRITCDDHQTYDSDWLDLRDNRRTGDSVQLGRIELRRR